MTIGPLDFGQRPVFLAPMEDVTDVGFRTLCRQLGASMAYSEFVSSDALVRQVNRSFEKLRVDDRERPIAIQIYGRFVEAMREAAQIVVEAAHPDVLDLNFGCPVKKIAAKGAGAGLLQNIPLMLEITRAVVDAVPQTPVTAKTRLGWDCNHLIIEELAEQLQDCGIKALTIHGRTRSQMYTGEADWTLIGKVKENPRMRIPVIGNGDICSAQRAKECFDCYGVDAVMVGRASFGRPWIFKEIRSLLDGQPCTITTEEKLLLLKRQVRSSVALLDERRGILHVRRHLASTPLFKGIPDFRATRIRLLRAETVSEIFRIIDEEIAPRLNYDDNTPTDL
ncbi:MAG: tRNA dihydrouridine synthase DusB [Prevotellaceae bacterium]|nr:tRNA dihydrouridine synthase DusB [Prevotellaceae bacterium]